MTELSPVCPIEPLNDFVMPLRIKATSARTPLYCNFALTHRCSFRCQHCYLGDQQAIRRHHTEELTTEEVLAILDQLIQAGTLFLTLTGGDPLIREDFAEIYTHAVRSGLLVTIYCNGSLIDDAVISLWKRYPPAAVEISMYGATEETFESITQLRDSFALFQQGTERLHKNGIRYRLKTVLLKSNSHELDLIEAKAEELGVHFRYDSFIFPAMPCSDNNGRSNIAIDMPVQNRESGFPLDTLMPGPEKHQETYKMTVPMLAPLGLRLSASEIIDMDLATEKRRKPFLGTVQPQTPSPRDSSRLFRCGAGRLTCHINPYGRMTPCIVALEPACDLRRQSFQQAWNGPLALFPQIRLNKNDKCYSCRWKQECTVCPSLSVLETGSYHVPSPEFCEIIKKRLIQLDIATRK